MTQRRLAAQRALQLIFAGTRMEEDFSPELDNNENDAEEIYNNDSDDEDIQQNGDENVSTDEGDSPIESESENESSNTSEESQDDDSDNIEDINWISRPPLQRLRQRNIVTEQFRSIAHPKSEQEAFHLFISEGMLRDILRHTNRKAHDIRNGRNDGFMKKFSYEELNACLAVTLRAGVDRDNFTCLEDMWSTQEGRPFYKASISLKRFKFSYSV
jgi:hypothetical protein